MDKKKKSLCIIVVLIGIVIAGAVICISFVVNVKKNTTIDMTSFSEFEVTSDNLNNGKWDDVITNTAKGKNESPQLQWNPVSGAKKYAVIMVDPDGNNWLHWYAVTDKIYLEQGEFTGASNGYVGPYPPSGTHQYMIYVFALQEEPVALTENVDSAGAVIEQIASELNSSQMSDIHNNILAVAKISGTYSKTE